jgi:hypothetical protein
MLIKQPSHDPTNWRHVHDAVGAGLLSVLFKARQELTVIVNSVTTAEKKKKQNISRLNFKLADKCFRQESSVHPLQYGATGILTLASGPPAKISCGDIFARMERLSRLVRDVTALSLNTVLLY